MLEPGIERVVERLGASALECIQDVLELSYHDDVLLLSLEHRCMIGAEECHIRSLSRIVEYCWSDGDEHNTDCRIVCWSRSLS